MWMLDIDYDGMTLNPEQIFFPMAGSKDGWSKLAKTLKSEVDPELIEMYRGVESIPFSIPGSTKIAVKIIDDRGIESMKILNIEGQK
jgi:adenine-specific DNA-methyltransferase